MQPEGPGFFYLLALLLAPYRPLRVCSSLDAAPEGKKYCHPQDPGAARGYF
jgi:hypothetical protein